jgi:hypothetical protein
MNTELHQSGKYLGYCALWKLEVLLVHLRVYLCACVHRRLVKDHYHNNKNNIFKLELKLGRSLNFTAQLNSFNQEYVYSTYGFVYVNVSSIITLYKQAFHESMSS